MTHPIIFYDAECGLCAGFVEFVLPRDSAALFRFAPLQSVFARDLLLPHGVDPGALESVNVLVDGGTSQERVLTRATAVLYVLSRVSGPRTRTLASLLGFLPPPLLDTLYRLVARSRHRLSGRGAACPLPQPRWRSRFLGTDNR